MPPPADPDPSVPVVVLGAGPAGLLAALLLGRQGVEVVVLDRRADVVASPRAVHLDDEVYRLLGRAGVADAFAAVSRPSQGLRLLDSAHRVLAEFGRTADGARHGYPQANMFDQPDLERVLHAALQSLPQVQLRGDVEVTGVRQGAGGPVRLDCTDRRTGQASPLLAGHVLGCDGAGSLTRAAIGSRMRDLGLEQRWLVVDVATDADLAAWEGVHQVCDPRRAATYMRIGPTRYRWEFQLLDGESAAEHQDPQRLLRLLAPWTGALATDRLEVLRVAEYTFRAQVADRWRDRRVFLLGDAAHLTPPFIGQGLGAGLRDAANLAWKLAGVLRGELDDAALDSYQAEREPHTTTTIRLAVLAGRTMTAGGRSGDLLRRVVAPRLHLLPGVRARVLDSETARLHRSALVRRPPFGRLPGRLVPNLPVRQGVRVDDLAPGRFLVVAGTPVAARHRATVDARGAVLLAVAPGDPLHRWLSRGRAGAAVVRPDGAVLAAGRDLAAVLPALPAFRVPQARA